MREQVAEPGTLQGSIRSGVECIRLAVQALEVEHLKVAANRFLHEFSPEALVS